MLNYYPNSQSWTDFELIGIENTNTGCFQTNFRITRYNRTVATIHGNFNVVGSFKDYDVIVTDEPIFESLNDFNLRTVRIENILQLGREQSVQIVTI